MFHLAGVDKGYHNLYYAVRPTGECEEDGLPKFETRTVKKTWYDKVSGRSAILKKSKYLTRLAQRLDNGVHMESITNNTIKTADYDGFIRGINARRDSWSALYIIWSNKELRRLKLAMRSRESSAMDKVINYITWNGTIVPAIGDCSRTTGIRGLPPGGPLKKIERRMIKRGFSAFEVNESYSTKSSVCCHGSVTYEQPNGQNPATYKVKRGQQPTGKPVPTTVHGIRICKECGRTWNRDVTGGLNIWYIAVDHLIGFPRHWRFTKKIDSETVSVERQLFIPSLSGTPIHT
jgi:hypothetical protein